MASPNIVNLTKENFTKEVLESPTPVLVDFSADWCGPCKMLAPVLDELADEYVGRVKICKVDVDTEQELAARFGVTSIPTLLFFKSGQVVEQMRGLKSKRVLKESLDRVAG